MIRFFPLKGCTRLLFHRKRRNKMFIRLLRSWLSGDEQEQRETFQALQQAMPEHFIAPSESVSEPLGGLTHKQLYRHVDTQVRLEDGVKRVRERQSYVKRGEE